MHNSKEHAKMEYKIYHDLQKQAIRHIRNGQNEFDHHISKLDDDNRRGISLLFRPAPKIRAELASFSARKDIM
jgi:hypothetical protein